MRKVWSRRTGACAALAALAMVAAIAGSATAGSTEITPPDVPAVRLDGSEIQIDGLIEEAPWQLAAPITGMTSFDPADGQPPASQLAARVFYDHSALYIAARITTLPHQLRGRLAAREQWANDDLFQVVIDPFLDRRTGYEFMSNPYGVQLDATIEGDELNTDWDGVWDAATRRYEDGFSVEMRIPFRTLRFSAASVQHWGFGLGVFSGAKQQYDKWPPSQRDRGTIVAQLGTLRGLDGLRRSHNVDVLPSLTASYGGSNPGTGFQWDEPTLARARDPGIVDLGLDVAWALGSASSLNLTVNPDFSQVEADAEQLTYNLRFPLVLDEKRPFFLDGAGAFVTPVALLYTRSIIDPIAGAKLSGRSHGWSLGILSVWDQLPLPSRVVEAERPSGFEDVASTDAINTVARVARDVGSGSRVGLSFVDKVLYDRAAGALGARNEVVSADASLTLGEIYSVRAQGGWSHVGGPGSEAAGDLGGGFYFLDARRRAAQLLLALHSEYYGKEFRAEVSPLSRVGIAPSSAELRYHLSTGSELVPYLEGGVVGSTVQAAASGELLDWSVRPTLAAHLGKNTDLSLFVSRGQETFVRRFSGIDLAGVELTAYPWNSLSVAAKLQGGDQIHYDPDDLFLGSTVLADLHATVLPRDNLELGLGYTRSLLWRPEGDREADVSVYYLKIALSFTTRFSIRIITQLDDSEDLLRSSALLSYVAYPRTEAYLGYEVNDGSFSAGTPRAIDRRMFLKLSYRWQL